MLLLHSLLFFALGISVFAVPISPMTHQVDVHRRASLSQKIKGTFHKVKGMLKFPGKHTNAPVAHAPQAVVKVKIFPVRWSLVQQG